MVQEYVIVEDPHAVREKPKVASSPRSRRVRAAWVTVVALVAGGMGLALALPDSEPDPLPEPEERIASAARATALAYQEWLDRSVLVECMSERGFPYEVRIVDNSGSLETVAQYLEIEPATAHPDAPVPMLRQPDLYLGRGGAAMAERTRGGSACTMPRTALSTDDEEAVNSRVSSARADEAFLATVSEQVWVQQHPAEVTHAISLLRHDRSSDAAAGQGSAWSEFLAVVVDQVQDGATPGGSVWVPVVTESQTAFSQSVGLTASGGAVAVRVGEQALALDRGTHMTRADAIPCGPVTVSAAVKQPWGTSDDLEIVMGLLGPACNALIREELVEGESLADVYFD